MKDSNHVVLLTSGGADSLAASILLRKAGYELTYLFLDYGQPAAEAELAQVKAISKTTGLLGDVKVSKVDILTKFDPKNLNSQEIVLRNFVFMSIASQVAKSIDAGAIATGYVDMVNATHFMDDDPRMLQDFGDLVYTYFGLRLLLPTAGLDKEMVYSLIISDGNYSPYILPVCNINAEAGLCGKCEKCVSAEKIIVDTYNRVEG